DNFAILMRNLAPSPGGAFLSGNRGGTFPKMRQSAICAPTAGKGTDGRDLPPRKAERGMTKWLTKQACHRFGEICGTESSFQCSSCISSRSDEYRQRAVEAKNRAAQTSSPSIKSAFEDVARGWLLLAEQLEWIERQRSSLRGEDTSN